MTTLTRDAHLPAQPPVSATVVQRVMRLQRHGQDIAAAVAALGLGAVQRQGAGQDGWWLLIGLLCVVPLLVAVKAWRLPLVVLGVAAALPVSVLAVAGLAPGGAVGVERGGGYAYGALVAVGALGWARTPARRGVATGVGMLVVLDQFATSWLPWWGSEDPSTLMIGTFYWHNQFGAFCLGGAALALGLVHLATGRVRAVAVLIGAFAVVGVLLSGSRASLFALLVAWVVCLVLGVRAHGPVRAVGRSAVQAAASLGVGTLLVSPLFFSRWGLPWGPVGNRLADGSLDGNTTARWEFWAAGMRIAAEHPWVGPGLETFGEVSRPLVPTDVGLSADPHNELVRGFAEGGLLGGLPLLGVIILAVVVAVASARAGWSRQELTDDPARWAALVAAGALVAHALVDFDWSYPALTALAGLALGIAGAPLVQPGRRPPPRVPRAAAGAALVVVAAVAALLCGGLQQRTQAALSSSSTSDDRAAWTALAPDHRLALSVLNTEVGAGRPSSPDATWAWAAMEERVSVDAATATTYVELLSAAGRHDEAVDLSGELASRAGARGVPYLLRHAQALADSGQDAAAAEQAARAVTLQAQQAWHTDADRERAVASATELTSSAPVARACVGALAEALADRTPANRTGALGPGLADCAAFE